MTNGQEKYIDKLLSTQDINNNVNDLLIKDLLALNGDNCLNDCIINQYFKLIVDRSVGKIYAFSSFFYPKLKSSGYDSVIRWTKGIDIFSFHLILIPIHLGFHWTLAVIFPCQNKIKYYDSLNADNEDCFLILREYLCQEYLRKKVFTTALGIELEWKCSYEKAIPQQTNGVDCGAFICKYAEFLAREKAMTFEQATMPKIKRAMIWELTNNQFID